MAWVLGFRAMKYPYGCLPKPSYKGMSYYVSHTLYLVGTLEAPEKSFSQRVCYPQVAVPKRSRQENPDHTSLPHAHSHNKPCLVSATNVLNDA